MYRFKDRLAREEGFTLIELLVVVAIIGILLAIAVPSYLGFKDSANQKASAADVRAAIPSAEQYYADNGSYSGMTVARLTALTRASTSTTSSSPPATRPTASTRASTASTRRSPAAPPRSPAAIVDATSTTSARRQHQLRR